jgi:predicted Rossmann fold flavoprotein
MCALTAGARGRRVLVLERANRIGKKILMSGGGKCNFTNLHVSPQRFLSANPHFCKSALARYTQWDFIALVERHGIEWFEKETVNGLSGQLFCRESSKQIVAMLRSECEAAGVDILTGCDTQLVEHGSHYTVHTTQGTFAAGALVVASGALSIPSLGGSGLGYELARQFGLELLPTHAGLVPLTFSGAQQELFGRLSGVSCEVIAGNARAQFREDLLFTHRGLSGPAILQLSSSWQPGEPMTLELLPGIDALRTLLDWKREQPRAQLRTPLSLLLPRSLVLELEPLAWPEQAEARLADWPDRRLEAVAELLQGWELRPSGTEGYRTAEVTLGGVDTRQLSSKDMQSQVPGLFFIGEVVDVTGHLGGFNFQWAWASGHAAGMAL